MRRAMLSAGRHWPVRLMIRCRAASNAIVAPDECYPVEEVATGIYTIPEISTLGKTEAELTA